MFASLQRERFQLPNRSCVPTVDINHRILRFGIELQLAHVCLGRVVVAIRPVGIAWTIPTRPPAVTPTPCGCNNHATSKATVEAARTSRSYRYNANECQNRGKNDFRITVHIAFSLPSPVHFDSIHTTLDAQQKV